MAGVLAEEFDVYRQVHATLREQSEKERPFERVKPSLRKKYERRAKTVQEPKDYEFE